MDTHTALDTAQNIVWFLISVLLVTIGILGFRTWKAARKLERNQPGTKKRIDSLDGKVVALVSETARLGNILHERLSALEERIDALGKAGDKREDPGEDPGANDVWTFYKDEDKLWRWKRQAPNHEIVGASTEGYGRKRDCVANARRNGYKGD